MTDSTGSGPDIQGEVRAPVRTMVSGGLRALVLADDAVRTCASIEVARSRAGEDAETLRIVPLPERGRALGALAFSRRGQDAFSTDSHQLIDGFAGRVALALRRAR